MYSRHLSPSIPEIERDHEDILMIQYSNNAQNNANANNNAEPRENRTVRDRDSQIGGNISISVTNNENTANNANEQPQNFLFNSNFPILYNENSEQGGTENSNSAPGNVAGNQTDAAAAPINTNAPPPNNHPLLSGRPDGASTDRVDDRLHVNDGLQTARRSNRTRRYQFINISSRNQPVILQRMLELRQSRQAGQNATGGNDPLLFRDGTRVVVMDNGFSIFSSTDDLDFEMVDQSGYWFGRTLANHLNNHPSALSWWQEENKISGPDSNSDLCMVICDEILPEIDSARAAELSKIRGKRKKKLAEEEEAKQRNQEGKKTNEEETAEIHVQPEVALSSVLTNIVPVPVEPIRLAEPIQFRERPESDQQQSTATETTQAATTNNLNISFMDTNEGDQSGRVRQDIQPITISTQIVQPPQHITTANQLNLDLDVDMASDNEESSASANNSRSFSPNYSPNSNQIETGEMNMLNRAPTPNYYEHENQVGGNNLNIQDGAENEQDHPMGDVDSENGETVNEMNSMTIEASQVPLPTDSESSDDTEDDTEDDDDDDGDDNRQRTESEGAGADGATENAQAEENAAASVINQPEMDPTVRAILGDLVVPEGVDPTFLAALPQEMRDEVIQEHLR
jgi:E3 ubiquitin-protein ligase HUWE1